MRTNRWMMCAAVAILAQGVIGCTPPEEHIAKVLDAEIEKCKAGEGEFIELMTARDKKKKVMRAACEMERTEVKMGDQFSGVVTTGPYTWRAELDEETRVWIFTNVTFDSLDRALAYLRSDSLTPEDLKALDERLGEAQEKMPTSEWIRTTRLEKAFMLREKTRKGSDAIGIGDDLQKQVDAYVAWSKEAGKAELEQKAKAMVVQYLVDYDGKLASSLEAVTGPEGASFEMLQKSVDLARKEGDEKGALEYEKELAERRAKRIVDAKMLTKKREDLKVELCKKVTELSTQGVTDNALSGQIASLKSAAKCN